MTEESRDEFKVNDRRGQQKPEEKKPAPPPVADSAKTAAPAAAPAAEKKVPPPKGSVDFSQFVMSLSTSAAIFLGLVEDPQTGIIQKNLNHARQQIDLIELLQYKTQGNLTPEEKNLIDQIVYELKVRYMEALKTP